MNVPARDWSDTSEKLQPLRTENIILSASRLLVKRLISLTCYHQDKSLSVSDTSKRFCRVGMSTAVRSIMFLNWALVWSLRKVSTGTTPSGWIITSSSLKQVTYTHRNTFSSHLHVSPIFSHFSWCKETFKTRLKSYMVRKTDKNIQFCSSLVFGRPHSDVHVVSCDVTTHTCLILYSIHS